MNKLSFLIDELRRLKVIGPSSDFCTGTIIWQSSETMLVRFVDSQRRVWVSVWRSSRQYYKVTVYFESLVGNYAVETSFRNYRLTADYINNIFRR